MSPLYLALFRPARVTGALGVVPNRVLLLVARALYYPYESVRRLMEGVPLRLTFAVLAHGALTRPGMPLVLFTRFRMRLRLSPAV